MKLVSTSLVAGALMLASTQVATPSPATTPLVVKATILPNLVITFSPKAFKHGTVAIKVKNRAPQAHQFAINGVSSAYIKPHAAVVVTVTFKQRAVYSATRWPTAATRACVRHRRELRGHSRERQGDVTTTRLGTQRLGLTSAAAPIMLLVRFRRAG